MISLGECFDRFRVSAFRLETLPLYDVPAEEDRIAAFRAGRPLPERSVSTSPWLRHVADTTAEGKRWSRVHVVDIPLSEYTRFEMVTYAESARAGESIRIAERNPVLENLRVDFWLFDRETDHPFAALMDYDADGHYLGAEVTEEAERVAGCSFVQDLAVSYSVPLSEYLEGKEIEAA